MTDAAPRPVTMLALLEPYPTESPTAEFHGIEQAMTGARVAGWATRGPGDLPHAAGRQIKGKSGA